MSKTLSRVLLGAMLLAALGLRTYGANFPISYGPDQERHIAWVLRFFSGDLNPQNFIYPTFYPYVLLVSFTVLRWLTGISVPDDLTGVLSITLSNYDEVVPALSPYYFQARFTTALFGTATIAVTYLIGKHIGGLRTGLLAALFLTLTPLHIWDSHLATVDVPATFWFALALYFGMLGARIGGLKWLVLSGLAAGLSASTKYPAITVIAIPVMVGLLRHWEQHEKEQMPFSHPILGAGIVAVGIVAAVAAGYALLQLEAIETALIGLTVSKELPSALMPMVGQVLALALAGDVCVIAWGVLLYRLPGNSIGKVAHLPFSKGVLLPAIVLVIAFLGASPFLVLDWYRAANDLYAVASLARADEFYGFDTVPSGIQFTQGLYFLLAGFPFALGFGLYALCLGGIALAVVRRTLEEKILLMAFCTYYLGSGIGTMVFLRHMMPALVPLCLAAALFSDHLLSASRSTVVRVAGMLFIMLVVLYTAAYSYSTTRRYAEDTRLLAERAFSDLIPGGASIAETGFPNYFPSVDASRYRLVACPQGRWDPVELMACDAEFIILSSMVYSRAYRDPVLYRSAYEAYQALRTGQTHYEKVGSFSSTYLNQDLYIQLDPMFEGYFVSPTIEVYRRRGSG